MAAYLLAQVQAEQPVADMVQAETVPAAVWNPPGQAVIMETVQSEQLVADMAQSETVPAAVGNSPGQAVIMETVGAVPAEITNDESLQLEVYTADAIHAEILAPLMSCLKYLRREFYIHLHKF